MKTNNIIVELSSDVDGVKTFTIVEDSMYKTTYFNVYANSEEQALDYFRKGSHNVHIVGSYSYTL